MYNRHGSNLQPRKTTKGWSLCVEWKNGSTSWECLANLKESHSIEVADYAITHGLDTEPAFAWWVPFTLKRRNRIIAAVNKRYQKRTHKFGIKYRKRTTIASETTKKMGYALARCLKEINGEGDSRVQDIGQLQITSTYLPGNTMPHGIRRQNGELSTQSPTSCRRPHDQGILSNNDIRQCLLERIGHYCLDPCSTHLFDGANRRENQVHVRSGIRWRCR